MAVEGDIKFREIFVTKLVILVPPALIYFDVSLKKKQKYTLGKCFNW